jgi:hypothetical protein
MKRRLRVALGLAFALAALSPAMAAAEIQTHTFVDVGNLFPDGNANSLVGPANVYPATIEVPPYPALITKVTATVIDLGSGEPEDIDMALVGPDGTTVMLMSDACGKGGLQGDNWTFDDEAPTFLSRLGCGRGEDASFKPTNYFEEATPDNMVVGGVGPGGPFHNSLEEFDGLIPGGLWKLYVLDDSEQVVGFGIAAWSLTIDVDALDLPPEPPATTPPASGVGPVTTAPPVTVAPPPPAAAPKRTGRRAAALTKCKKKSPGKPRRRCRAHARKLPV